MPGANNTHHSPLDVALQSLALHDPREALAVIIFKCVRSCVRRERCLCCCYPPNNSCFVSIHDTKPHFNSTSGHRASSLQSPSPPTPSKSPHPIRGLSCCCVRTRAGSATQQLPAAFAARAASKAARCSSVRKGAGAGAPVAVATVSRMAAPVAQVAALGRSARCGGEYTRNQWCTGGGNTHNKGHRQQVG